MSWAASELLRTLDDDVVGDTLDDTQQHSKQVTARAEVSGLRPNCQTLTSSQLVRFA